MQVIDILLIDDEKEYCQSLRSRFLSIGEDSDLNIQVKGFQNLEDGFAELEKDNKYKAVILDAKALIKTDQETADLDFLPVALHRLEKLNQKTGRIHTPFAVITGYYDNFLSFDTLIKEQKGKLFDKSSQEEEMLQYLLNEIENSENTKIEKQYADVFEVFNKGYLTSSYRTDLLEILRNLENTSRLKDKFNPLRKFLEPIYKAIKAKNTSLIPDIVFYNRNGKDVNLDWIHRYITGQKVTIPPPPNRNGIDYQRDSIIPFHTGWGIKYLEELGSKISHDYTDEVTIYAYKSAVFGLLEILLWFRNLMEKP